MELAFKNTSHLKSSSAKTRLNKQFFIDEDAGVVESVYQRSGACGMRKPIIFKDHCDDDLPWACCYEDDESNVEWSEGRFYIGFGKTAIAAYEDWKNKKGLEELKKWHNYSDYQKLVEYTQKLPTSFIKVLDDNFWELVLK